MEKSIDINNEYYLNISDAAREFGINRKILYRHLFKNYVYQYRKGAYYFKRKDIEEFMWAYRLIKGEGRKNPKYKRKKSYNVIRESYKKLSIFNNKVTQSRVSRDTGLSISTVKRYWHTFNKKDEKK